MKVGVFGGSFDPIHLGHLLLAETCREQAELHRILFVPAAVSPLKPHGPQASERQRIEMLRLAIAGHPAFEISTAEIDRGGTSYTVETLQALHEDDPDSEYFLMIGSDSLAQFDQWHEPKTICELATPLVVSRRGTALDLNQLEPYVNDDRLAQIRAGQVEFPWIEISSTDIRERLATGRSIRYRVTRAVEKYIETGRLYSGQTVV